MKDSQWRQLWRVKTGTEQYSKSSVSLIDFWKTYYECTIRLAAWFLRQASQSRTRTHKPLQLRNCSWCMNPAHASQNLKHRSLLLHWLHKAPCRWVAYWSVVPWANHFLYCLLPKHTGNQVACRCIFKERKKVKQVENNTCCTMAAAKTWLRMVTVVGIHPGTNQLLDCLSKKINSCAQCVAFQFQVF